ncbi:MAG: DUF5615 family PIN-like protein [Acidobacteria bacterium]|nr:DUF5615 family PIN-like protein [Acidobacteriota bacterium]
MARFYANENFPYSVVEKLRELGHDVTTVRETGKANRSTPDAEVLDYAVSEQRAVLTVNRKHFLKLHFAGPQHAGIILCTYHPDFSGQARRIHESVQERANLSGQLIRVNRPNQTAFTKR